MLKMTYLRLNADITASLDSLMKKQSIQIQSHLNHRSGLKC